MSCPLISKKYSARLACSARRSFSRSAALTCAAYCSSWTVLRMRPKRSGSQETLSGTAARLLCCPPLNDPAELPRLEEERERDHDGAVPTVGKYSARASRTSARASMKFSKYSLMVWLSILSWSSSALSSGSLKISHHLPRSIASEGLAGFHSFRPSFDGAAAPVAFASAVGAGGVASL